MRRFHQPTKCHRVRRVALPLVSSSLRRCIRFLRESEKEKRRVYVTFPVLYGIVGINHEIYSADGLADVR